MTDTAELKPVAWRVKDYADGWIFYTDEKRARIEAEIMSGALVEPLYSADALSSLVRERDELRHDNEMLTKGGIIEVAIRNFSVADYMQHWEARATAAEADRDSWRRVSERLEGEKIAAEADAARMREALEAIDTWAKAYPLTVFPEPDSARVRDLLAAGGITVDAVSASNMRHVLDGIAGIVGAALSNTSEGGKDE